MPVYVDLREKDAVTRILREIKEQQIGTGTEHLFEIVVHEAQHHGIKPEISAPIARQLLEKKDIPAP